jgi:hypothetical protein
MEGFFPLSRMTAGGRGFGEEGNVLPSTASMITGMEKLLSGRSGFHQNRFCGGGIGGRTSPGEGTRTAAANDIYHRASLTNLAYGFTTLMTCQRMCALLES